MRAVVRTGLLLAFLALFAALAWVAVRGSQARGHLEDAADGVALLQQQMSHLQVTEAADTVEAIQRHTAKAQELTSDPVWDVLGEFPWGGQNLEAVGVATNSVDALAHQGLPALVDAGEALVIFRDQLAAGHLDSEAAQRALTDVGTLERSLQSTRAELEEIDRSYVVRAISQALDELTESLDAAGSVTEQLETEVSQQPIG